jgi:hypothetical protein
VAGDVGALTRQRRRQLLDPVTSMAALAALTAPHYDHVARLVEPQ